MTKSINQSISRDSHYHDNSSRVNNE